MGDGNGRRCWFAVALGLLLLADPLTTLWAISLVGPGGEANPFMRWLVDRGVIAVLIVHALVAGVAVIGFERVVRVGDQLAGAPARRYRVLTDVWVGGLVVLGAIIVTNNVLVIVVAR